MGEIVGFKNLKVGQRVKIKGLAAEGGKFNAVEISIKPGEEGAALEGKVQGVDPARNVLRFMFREFSLPTGTLIKNLQRHEVGLQELKAGDVVKIKGAYSAARGLAAEKIKMQEARGFGIEELQSQIDGVDAANHTIAVLGFTVQVTEKTEIEGI